MRIKLYFVTLVVIALTALTVGAQSNTFTYQGRLTDNNLAAVGTYEMQFRVFDAAVAGNQLPVGTPVTLNFTVAGTNPVTVSNGAFTVQLNFGNGVFTGADRWLEISVRKPSDPPGFTLLTPRQPITSSPYSIKTLNANAADSLSSACVLCITDAQISGIDAGKVTGVVGIANGGTGSSTQNFVDLTTPQTITGAKIMSSATNVFTGSGAGLTNISPTNISPGTASINIAGIAAAPAVVTSGATPSVANRTMVTLDYATPTEITDLTGGVDGQCVVLLSLNNSISFTNGVNFRLTNRFTQGNNYISNRLFTDSTLTVCRSSASGGPIWYETTRAINSVVNFLLVSMSGNGAGTVTSSPAGINCVTGVVQCVAPFALGEVATLTATASPGSTFTGWSGSCSGTGTCVIAVNQNMGVTATFTLITFPLQVTKTAGGSVTSSPAGINCGGDCNENYPENTVVTLTRQTDAGASFLGWGGACSAAGTALTCDVTMDAAKSVSATFGLVVNVTKTGAGGGTVTSSPGGINCGANCSAFFTGDSTPTLTATPNAGSVFTGWSGSCSGTGTCNLSMNGQKNVTATFAPQQFTLSVAKAGTGSGTVTSSPTGINCGADCTEAYNNGTSVVLTAAPNAGSTFAGWSGGGCSGTGTCTTTVTAATTVTATFDPAVPNWGITVSSMDFGTTTVGTPVFRTFSVGNDGASVIFSPTVSITGVDASEFQLFSTTCASSWPNGYGCTMQVRFLPTSNGAKSASFHYSSTPGNTVAYR
ncbi:MAG: choice-of-anchor D domain-containing protein [Chloracidobacterium sp.]|nr:choice-of-anchor D domain-containing protein [Chloracidobacterium sp.]